jgi:hypothetical protein
MKMLLKKLWELHSETPSCKLLLNLLELLVPLLTRFKTIWQDSSQMVMHAKLGNSMTASRHYPEQKEEVEESLELNVLQTADATQQRE